MVINSFQPNCEALVWFKIHYSIVVECPVPLYGWWGCTDYHFLLLNGTTVASGKGNFVDFL